MAQYVYTEGLILPQIKLNFTRDWENGPFRKLIEANVRVPRQTMGDIDAQLASNRVGILRMRDLAARYGADLLLVAMSELQAYSEARMRSAIRALPDGIYEGTDGLDNDGLDGPDPVVKARLIVRGDEITVDYEGTSAQVRSSINSPFASTISVTVSCLKAALTSADIPFQRWGDAPDHGDRAEGMPAESAPLRAGQITPAKLFARVQRDDEGAGHRGTG
ncbi:hydantoinase B/oxoprolinase family protein [Paenirhodobacter populi]|uniref:hydantoinase B/oxoprolinase family protein n=1 Tax=Paenirhodobacter populi TaxID=2306993 RepID=UPI0013E2C23E|nr:hydantoinase B/oxoprolinase family protein [Sinirhodobacter populi]